MATQGETPPHTTAQAETSEWRKDNTAQHPKEGGAVCTAPNNQPPGKSTTTTTNNNNNSSSSNSNSNNNHCNTTRTQRHEAGGGGKEGQQQWGQQQREACPAAIHPPSLPLGVRHAVTTNLSAGDKRATPPCNSRSRFRFPSLSLSLSSVPAHTHTYTHTLYSPIHTHTLLYTIPSVPLSVLHVCSPPHTTFTCMCVPAQSAPPPHTHTHTRAGTRGHVPPVVHKNTHSRGCMHACTAAFVMPPCMLIVHVSSIRNGQQLVLGLDPTMCALLYGCLCVRASMSKLTHVFVYLCVCVCVCLHVCVCACMNSCMCYCVCVCVCSRVG